MDAKKVSMQTPLLQNADTESAIGEGSHSRENGGSNGGTHLEAVSGKRKESFITQRSVLQRLSGKWQFKHQKFLQDGAFSDSDSVSEGKRDYNRRQRETLAMFQEVDSIDSMSSSTDDAAQLSLEQAERFAVNISNISNLLLLIMKVYATVKSGSLAIAASTLDSLLDLLAGFILWFAQWSMHATDKYTYPIGKLRVQPVGIIVFAAIMATLGLQVLIEGVRQLFEGPPNSRMSPSQRLWVISIMGSAIVVKLVLFLYCRSFKNDIIQAYGMDHYFDVVTNVVGLAAALLADWFYWWIDPVGAILLALYTIINWSKTVFENAVSLIAKTAPPQILQKLTYMAFNHHYDIKHIDTVRAYTFGTLYFVEVDIELPEEMPLKEAHDIGQSLQDKLEALPEVERAFVHLDFESRHTPEHQSSLNLGK